MKIVWGVNDGYVGKSRYQYTDVSDDGILNCDTVEEAMAMIDQAVQDDFEQKISWYLKDREKIQVEVEKLFETKIEDEE